MNFGICFKQRLGTWNRLGFMSQVNWLKSLPLDGVLTWSFLGNRIKTGCLICDVITWCIEFGDL